MNFTDAKQRFSDRVADYVRYRPGYPLALIEFGHRPKKTVLSFEPDGRILHRRRFRRWRCARKFAPFTFLLGCLIAAAFFLTGRRLRQKIELRFSKLKIVAQRHWQRNDPIEQAWLLRRAADSARERNHDQQCDSECHVC